MGKRQVPFTVNDPLHYRLPRFIFLPNTVLSHPRDARSFSSESDTPSISSSQCGESSLNPVLRFPVHCLFGVLRARSLLRREAMPPRRAVDQSTVSETAIRSAHPIRGADRPMRL